MFNLSSLLSFEKLLSTTLVRIVYFLGLAAGVITGLVELFAGLAMMRYSFTRGVGFILLAVLGTILGLLLWRVICESMIVLFAIHDRLGEIRDNTRRA
jgi:Domain of unknown function (DUF4282)